MKQLSFMTGCLLLCTATMFAQKSPVKFGEIPMADMTMTIYDKDSSAAAVILVDYGEAYVSITPVSDNLYFERHTRIKILKNDGLKWADVSIPLYTGGSSDEEKISSFKAATYNLENGKIVKTELPKSSMFKEKFNRNFNVQKFTFPNVKEGSVIEYSYKISSPYLANFPNWEFQHKIPVRHNEYYAIIPDFFIMERYMQGYVSAQFERKMQSNSGYSDVVNHWVIKDVPAFKEEPFMTNEEDYISRINFALAFVNFPGQPQREIMGSWERLVGTWMGYDSFGKAITGNNHLKKLVEQVTTGITEPEKKMEAIFNYVKNNIEWNGATDSFADNLKDILEKKKGTSGDINLLLASMLEKAGFEVEPIMLSTRDHGFIRKQYPMERQLNYVLCSVVLGDKRIFLDATEKAMPLGTIPERCLNGEAIRVSISQQRFNWITLEPSSKSKTTVASKLKLAKDGAIDGEVKITRSGYDAIASRKKIGKQGKEDYLKELTTSHSWELANSTINGLDDLNSNLEEVHQITIADHADAAGDAIYVSPFVGYNQKENPFKADERVYPIDFGSPFDRTLITTIEIPEGYTVDETPESKAMALPGNAGRLVYNTNVSGNVINITCMVSINKALFAQTDYALLREFYNQVVAKQREQIVLKKK